MRPTVLIIHPGTLGDVLLSLPAIRSIRCLYPTQEIGLLAKMEIGNVLRACGEVDTLFSLEGEALACLLSGPDMVKPDLRRWLSHCDLAVCWMKDPENRLASTLGSLGATRSIIGSPGDLGTHAAHQTERFLQSLGGMGSPVPPGTPLPIPGSVLAEAGTYVSQLGAETSSGLIAVHPGSGSPHKCANPSLFGILVDRLTHRGFTPLLVGGPADEQVLAQVVRACSSRPRVLQGLDLLTMAGLLAHVDLFVGHDSGLTHLAATVHIPTIAIFGPTDARRWGPRGPQVGIVTGEPCRCQGWEEVRVCGEKPCLRVTSEHLFKAVERVLERVGAGDGQP